MVDKNNPAILTINVRHMKPYELALVRCLSASSCANGIYVEMFLIQYLINWKRKLVANHVQLVYILLQDRLAESFIKRLLNLYFL